MSVPTIDSNDLLKAVDDEPELPGDMPEAMWLALRVMVEQNDREGMIEALRIAVRHTKSGIRDRIKALIEETKDVPR